MQRSGCGIYLVHSAAMHDDETCMEVSPVYRMKDEPWLLPGSALRADETAPADSSGGQRGCLQRGLTDPRLLLHSQSLQ